MGDSNEPWGDIDYDTTPSTTIWPLIGACLLCFMSAAVVMWVGYCFAIRL